MNIVQVLNNKRKTLAGDGRALYRLWRAHTITKNENLKVAFIFQLPEIWEKLSPVFEEMVNDKRFDPYIIVVPQYDYVLNQVPHSYSVEYLYVSDLYDSKRILKYYEEDSVSVDIKEFDYIFYPRPYDNYLPYELKAEKVSQYSRICYIPYGKETLLNTVQYNWDFFRNVTLIFLAGQEEKEFFACGRRRFVHNKWQKILWVGYPIFQECYAKRLKHPAKETVLWTPRWSYDQKVGGSHFLEYKDIFVEMARSFPTVAFILRPHPLMWNNLINNSLMSCEEIEDYINILRELNITVDNNMFFSRTAEEASILITDISSIIPEFFLTERPIIYCPCDIQINASYKRLINASYVAENEKDIKLYLDRLLKGNDNKLPERKQTIAEEFEYLETATENILDCIYQDASKQNAGEEL